LRDSSDGVSEEGQQQRREQPNLRVRVVPLIAHNVYYVKLWSDLESWHAPRPARLIPPHSGGFALRPDTAKPFGAWVEQGEHYWSNRDVVRKLLAKIGGDA
jgi:hypothetical protein